MGSKDGSRLLQLVGDLFNEVFDVLIVPSDHLVIFLNGEALLAEGNDVEGSILVAISCMDDGLEQATALSEEVLGSLLGSAVDADTTDDGDLLEVAAVGQHVHARHSGSLDVTGDGDSRHGLASVVSDLAEEVQESGGSVEAESEVVEDLTCLGSQLNRHNQF